VFSSDERVICAALAGGAMMLSTRSRRIWLAQHRIDFRKQHGGLLAESYKMGLDPYAGDVIIFVGRTRRVLKVLYADATGLFLTAKMFTLETMKTKFKFLTESVAKDITMAELSLLLEGTRYTIEKRVATYTSPLTRAAEGIRFDSPQHESAQINKRSPLARRTEGGENISRIDRG
jgi:transposase